MLSELGKVKLTNESHVVYPPTHVNENVFSLVEGGRALGNEPHKISCYSSFEGHVDH